MTTKCITNVKCDSSTTSTECLVFLISWQKMSLKLTNLAKNAVINAVILNSDTFLLQ